ncbi:MAG TPA: phosphoglycerate mutase, partial [Planctomycetaceae bacterium]|nr:phosphoglycerate mutase [Planctomycetaceae bacterium]
MDMHTQTRQLQLKNSSKIVMLVADGLGGLPFQPGGKTELETAQTPNLDALAAKGVQGLSIPVKPGIAPGSGPGHLGLFGYDPLQYQIGRGALEATGIGFRLQAGDVAIRCNFCTLDAQVNISDRRAGRISSEESAPLAISLRQVKIPGVEIFVEPVKEHRFVVVLRGPGLGGNVKDTDPQAVGVPPLLPV